MDTDMTISMGGEVAEFIKEQRGKTIRCFGVCHKEQLMTDFKGYPHEDGLKDAQGNAWWVFFECPKCQYGHSFGKMDFFLRRTKIERDAEKRY